MIGFHDVLFPLSVGFGASGGPTRLTEITQLSNGNEARNTALSRSRRRYNAGAGIRSLDDVHHLINFFEARLGQLFSFRFKDPMDHKSGLPSSEITPLDQFLGQGDGLQMGFQLTKNYTDIAGLYTRVITKPEVSTVIIAIDGTVQDTTSYDVNGLSGEVIFHTAPDVGAVITAGFIFHVPVRFELEQLELSLETFGACEVTNIPLVEVFDHA